MDFDSALTHAFSNTLMILVCIFVLLWFVKSMRRLYHAVNLRYYLMYDNVIEIAGLGSYLSYFDDASRAHLHAIVHTRQTKPPVQMDIAYVPLSLQHVHLLLNHDTHKRTLEIKFLTTTPGRLFLIPNLKIKKLKKSLQPQLRSLLLGGSAAAGSGSVAASQTISTEGVNKFTASSKQKQVINFIRRTVFNIPESVIAGAGGSKDGEEASQDLPWLCGQELCNTAKAPYVHCHPGLQVVKFNISEFFDKHRSNHVGNAADAELMELALVFVSTNSAKDMIISNIGTTYQAGPLSESTPRDTSASAAPRDDESVGSSINTSPDQRTGNENLLRDNGTDASLFSGIPILNNLFAASRVRTGSGFNENSPLNSPIANNNNNPANNYRPSTAGKELSNMGSNMEITIADFFMLQLPTNVDASATKKDVYPKDLYIMDLHGRVYNAMEVFGLNAVNDQANKPTTAVSPERPSSASSRGSGPSTKSSPKGSKRIAATDDDQSSQSSNDVSTIEPAEIRVRGVKRTKVADEENATSGTGDNAAQNNTTSPGLMISQGGKFPRDECVVCLTEAKEILLLPCRHLCVCSSCLTYVDKCPVCRAFFEEYVQIQSKQNVHFRV